MADKQAGEIEALALSDGPLPLNSGRIGTVKFVLGQQFRLVKDDDDWHASIESVLRMLVDDLRVPTIREDFREIFEVAERNFIEHRRWHA